jgi:dienelactone hydrolase
MSPASSPSSSPSSVLDGWTPGSLTAAGFTRPTFRRGSGPGVVVIHEIPGVTPKVAAFANDVVDAGFTVVMPSLMGTPGKAVSLGYGLSSVVRLCVAREFTHWATNQTSPIISWLRAVARSLHAECGGPGVGAVGMCFSGGFALGMMVDDVMVAPVLSQPSLPIAKGPGASKRAGDLNLSPDDALEVAQRAAQGCQVLGLRFKDDELVGDRFAALHELLGSSFIAVELDSPTPRAHSVLTEERDEPSVQRVIEFLTDRLRPTV